MTLSAGERSSAVWLKIRAHLEERLEMLRAKNDNDMAAEDTARLRGQIAEVKSLLSIGDEPIILPATQFD